MKQLLFAIASLFASASAFAQYQVCKVFIRDSVPCVSTTFKTCRSVTANLDYYEDRIREYGYTPVAYKQEADLEIDFRTYGATTVSTIGGPQAHDYSFSIELVNVSTNDKLNLNGSSRGIFGTRERARDLAFSKLPYCRSLTLHVR